MTARHLTLLDHVITNADRALRSLSQNTQPAARQSPAEQHQEQSLEETQRRHAAGLMRVNHSGEVCAQALYQGQALTAKLASVKEDMAHAADEEIDHLAWCEDRLKDLNSHTSALNPVWYAMSFSIGASAGFISDKLSLGFVAATEDQVCQHLRSHLEQLPENDARSRAVVEQMLEDEAKHAELALDAGGVVFPAPIKRAMTAISKAMTKSSYYI